MLSSEAHRELVELTVAVADVVRVAEARSDPDTVERATTRASEAGDRLAAITNVSLGNLPRHLGFIRRNFRDGRPGSSDGDLVDLQQHDLPGIAQAVEAWSTRLLDPALWADVSRSWGLHQYDAAVRDAFVFLEQQMRELAGVLPSDGLNGRGLVNRLLPDAGVGGWGTSGFLGPMTDGEQRGARELLMGSFALFRNATAHRPIEYSPAEAEDVMHLVNLCLRLLAKRASP
jgi:uncharacterized protein (TIGR02391 family)